MAEATDPHDVQAQLCTDMAKGGRPSLGGFGGTQVCTWKGGRLTHHCGHAATPGDVMQCCQCGAYDDVLMEAMRKAAANG